MSLAIGQAGLAAAFLTGQKALKQVHEINAYVLAALAVAMLLTAIGYRRAGSPAWVPWASGLLLLLLALQITLGTLKVAGVHIFLGVIFVTLATLFTSYLFRSGQRTRVGSVPTGIPGPGEAEQPEAGDPERHRRQEEGAER